MENTQQINIKKPSDLSELDIFHAPSELKQNCFESCIEQAEEQKLKHEKKTKL